jgi:hypothetical protein
LVPVPLLLQNGDGYVDTPAKEARILAAVADALNN